VSTFFRTRHSIERVVPTGHIFILMELDNMERKTFDTELNPIGSFKNVWVSGMQKKHLNISTHKQSEMLVIQFKPTGAFPFFNIPISALNDSVKHADNYFGNKILNVRNEIILHKNIADKFQIIERWLLEIFVGKTAPPQEIIDIVTLLQSQPFSRHNDLIKNYPKTNKNLINQFKKYCGHTPKVLHRIFRFNTLLLNINKKSEIVWTDIVYETGYADQSHFIKEFQEFCGFNPSKYIKNEYHTSIPNFFPIENKG